MFKDVELNIKNQEEGRVVITNMLNNNEIKELLNLYNLHYPSEESRTTF